MPSSTFSSEECAGEFHRASKVLLVCLALVCLVFEIGARFGLPRMSRLQERIQTERTDFVSSRPNYSTGGKTVGVVGNSLLLQSIDFASLNGLGSDQIHYSRFAIESTQYWDWYFGLRRLFEEGARPDAVAVLIGANHWVEDTVEGETFAYELLRSRDVGLLSAALHLDRTTASKYFFASWSAWLGTRSAIRKNLLRVIFPDIEVFTRKLVGPPAYSDADSVYQKAVQRVRDLKSVCEGRGVRLLIILHPTLDHRAPFDLVRRAAKEANVPVIAPVHLAYPPDLYSDGYHLNMSGMEKFTQAVSTPLERELKNDRLRLGSR